MIITSPCLFKHTRNDARVAMLSQCLLDHTQQKLYVCLISLLRNNISKSVHINLRHSVQCKFSQVLFIVKVKVSPWSLLRYSCWCSLFSDDHLLQLRSETVAIRRGKIYSLDDIWWPYDNRGRMWSKFPDICLAVEGRPWKNLNQDTDPTGDRTRARCVAVTMLLLDHNRGPLRYSG